jgi:hypothetical protein
MGCLQQYWANHIIYVHDAVRIEYIIALRWRVFGRVFTLWFYNDQAHNNNQ